MDQLIRLALLCLCLAYLTTEVTSQLADCSVPNWPDEMEGENPLTSRRGNVVLVALMKGYCGYCIRQARHLQVLHDYLDRRGFPGIDVVLVNGGENISRENIHYLQQASTFPVLQDTEDNVLYNDFFNAGKDDFIVYDRCGQRSFLIPHPYSYLGNVITEQVLRGVFLGRHNCTCNLDDAHRRPNRRRHRQHRNRGGRTPRDVSSVEAQRRRYDVMSGRARNTDMETIPSILLREYRRLANERTSSGLHRPEMQNGRSQTLYMHRWRFENGNRRPLERLDMAIRRATSLGNMRSQGEPLTMMSRVLGAPRPSSTQVRGSGHVIVPRPGARGWRRRPLQSRRAQPTR